MAETSSASPRYRTRPMPTSIPDMTPGHVKIFRSEHNLTQRQLSHLVGVALITVQCWEQSINPIPRWLSCTLHWYESLRNYQDASRTRVQRMRQRRADRELAESGKPDPDAFI